MNCLYQVSTIKNFTQGEFDGSIEIKELKNYGDTGMGTFNGLDGEMIMVAGEVFKADGNCRLKKADTFDCTPFSTLGFMNDFKSISINQKHTNLIKKLDILINANDPLLLASLRGKFLDLEIHSVDKQKKPYRRLKEIVDAQKIIKFSKIEGTMVATRCPKWAKNLNVLGWHFHFISKDQNWGGHVNNFEVEQVEINYSIKRKIVQIDQNYQDDTKDLTSE